MAQPNDSADRILQKTVRQRMEGGEPPGTEELWERFRAKHLRESRRTRLFGRPLIRLIAMVVAAVLVLAVLGPFAFPEQLRAIGNKLISVKTILTGNRQGNIRIVHDRPDQGNIPPPRDEESLSIEELRKKVPFPIRLPAYLPAGYQLVGHTLEEVGSLAGVVSSYEADGSFITVQQCTSDDLGYGQMFDVDDCKVTKLVVCGAQGTLVERKKDGWASLSWIQGGVFYRISGHLSPEEVLKTAESMKEI
ncbi:MAG: DUF4367 domain-containing protein [Bacillota bacterium]